MATQVLEDELSPAVMDVVLSPRQLRQISQVADTVGVDVVDSRLRCFAGIPLVDAPERLTAREASSFLLLLQTLYPW